MTRLEQQAALALFEEGKTQFRSERFQPALEHFERAQSVFAHPAIARSRL